VLLSRQELAIVTDAILDQLIETIPIRVVNVTPYVSLLFPTCRRRAPHSRAHPQHGEAQSWLCSIDTSVLRPGATVAQQLSCSPLTGQAR